MQVSRVVLRDKFNSLATNFAQLGTLLLDAATEMQNSGRPLSEVMIEELQTTRRDFEGLRDELIQAAEYFKVKPLPKADEIADLTTLEKLLNATIEAITKSRLYAEKAARAAKEEAAAQKLREETIGLLKRVLSLAHRTRSDFKPLQECHAQAAKLRETIAALTSKPTPSEEQTLCEAQKPYQALIYLVEEWNNLEGDQWDTLREEVAQYFGKELAAQAARGQLLFKNVSDNVSDEAGDVSELAAHFIAASSAATDTSLEEFEETPEQAAQLVGKETIVETGNEFDEELSASSSTEQAGDLPLSAWAGGKWPTLEEMAKALMDGKLALAADNAAAGETSEDEAPAAETFSPAPAESTASAKTAATTTVAKTAKSNGKIATSKTGKPAKGSTSKKGSSKEVAEAPENFGGSTLTQAALSHWSQMLEDLSETEAAALANQVNGHESGDSVNNAESLLDHNELNMGYTETESVSALSSNRAAAASRKKQMGSNVAELEVVPSPPTPPAIKSAPQAQADGAEAEPFQDYETVPQGFEDEDEREQMLYYVALEEKQTPFYFAEYADEPLYQLPLEFKAAQIATAIDSGAAPERLKALRDLLWRLLFEGQFGLAFHLARTLERAHREERICLPSWLIRVVTLGLNIRYDEGELAHQLKADLKLFTPLWLSTENAEWNTAVTLLSAAGALRTALLAPGTRAPRTLLQLPKLAGLAQFHDLCQELGKQCRDAKPLDPASLKHNKDRAVWQNELQELRHEVEAWWKQAPFKELDFAPANYVWRNWVEPQGPLRTLLPVSLPDTGDLASIKRCIKQWSDERQVRRIINHTDRELIGRSAGQKDIDGDAFRQILDYTREAVDLTRRWVALLECHPERGQRSLPAHVAPLRQFVAEHKEAVLQELERLKQQQPALPVLSGLSFCSEAIKGIAELLDPHSTAPKLEPKLRYTLYAPMLATDLPVNWRLKPDAEEPEAILPALVKTAAKGFPVDWQRVFARRSELRDHDATAYVIQYLADENFDARRLDEMRRDREQMLASCRAVLRQELEETRKLIAAALDFGYLAEKDYLKMAAKIDGYEAGRLLRFGAAHRELQTIRETIAAKREAAITALKEKVRISGVGADHYYYPHLCRVLERGDIVTAEDYLAMILDQQELPEAEEAKDNFASFYPEKARELSDYLKQVPLYAVIQRARAGADLCGLRLKDYDLDHVANAISAWFNSRRMQTVSEEELDQILNFIGFSADEVSFKQGDNGTWIDLEAATIIGRERSPVPAYGSEAKGRYRILCVWNRPTEGELLQQIGDTSFGSPVIVFYFGQMNDDMRPALARLCCEHRQTVIVIDDVLMLYLYGQRAPRLRLMFECTLPFTWTEPYTATTVAPEMFYGRVQERKSIMSPTGSGFVYGGRRLGKTALLRDVERNFHDPDNDRIAIFFDLEGENIGTQRQLDDIWTLIGERLNRLDVVSGSYNNPVSLLDQTCEWLDENPQRRILVLLDQADRFLEADEKEQFVRASRLRGVVEKTNRRFKVVFAGVHNIPRLTRVADHPLAQFGTPISIGPLLGHEAHEARKLIEEPLAALGYYVESPDLLRRILWRTNYYPSLIQHYCYHLLKYLANPNRPNAGFGPPYFITSEDVDEAYRSQDMRAAIRAGLLLTLQVDERYGVIAYAMADGLLQNGEETLTEGFAVSWIAQQVHYWWAEGFQSVLTDNALPVLLDEMVGLGILRATEKGYTLRSKGVAILLGNEDQIAAELQRTRKIPPKYNPSTFRAARTGSPRRSPLTAQEILELRSRRNGVSIVFGNEAAGLTDLPEFLEVASPRGFFVSLENEDRSDFGKQLNEAIQRRQDGTVLMMVLPSCDWDDRWIEDAIRRLGETSAHRAFARVAFIADPAKAWQLVNQQRTPYEMLPGKGVTCFSLKPWHDDALRQWLDDRSLNIDEVARERITAVTGNWPMLLEYFYQRCQIDSLQWMEHLRATAKDLKDKTAARDLARALGLDQNALKDAQFDVRRVLLTLENNGEQSVEELHQQLNGSTQGISEEMIQRVLWWAELFSLGSRLGPRWRVDHLVGRVLKTIGG